MKRYYIKKIATAILIVCIILISTRKIFPVILGKYYDDNIYLIQGFIKLILLLGTFFVLKKENLIDWHFTNKNRLLTYIISIFLIYFSLQHTFNRIIELEIKVTDYNHYAYLFQCFTTGFFEEVFFRIFIFAYVCLAIKNTAKNNYYKQVLWTSFLFSIIHLINLFNDLDFLSVVNQVVFAFFVGIILQSLFFRFNNIILTSVLHSLVNYFGMINTKLFKISNTSTENTSDFNFIQSLAIFIIIGIIVSAPICYVCLNNRENNLLRIDSNP